DLDDFRVAITPLTFDQIDTFLVARLITASGFPVGASAFVSASARPARKTRAPKINAAAKRKRHIDALMEASRCARLNWIAHARTSEKSIDSGIIVTEA